MGGDYSRVRFQPGKHFAAVLLQQGRVLTDSDWNEAEAIRDHWQRTLVRDLFGPCAFVGDGFALGADGERLTIAAGHAWIEGLLCELAADTDAGVQPDLPSIRLPTVAGSLPRLCRRLAARGDRDGGREPLEPGSRRADTSVGS